MNTIKGTIKMIGETKQITDTFQKREFVVTDSSGEYAQHILLQLVKDRCALLDQYKVGEEVEVSYFLNGREWTNPKDNSIRYFNSLDAWKIDYAGEHADAIQGEATAKQMSDDSDDDLPF